jgi:hypothetical protein
MSNYKGEEPDMRLSSSSIQSSPARTAQFVSLDKQKGQVMKKTIRRA